MEPSPFDAQHPDPIGHAAGEGGRKVAELVSVGTLLGQVTGQARARRNAEDAVSDLAAAEADMAAARAAWAPARDPGWRADADVADLARAWAAALPFEHDDQGAAAALADAERQLRRAHPRAMARFDLEAAAGADRGDAMLAAVGDLARHPDPSVRGPAPGLTDAEGDILSRLLGAVARLSGRAAEAGLPPLAPRDVAGWLRDDLPAGMAGRVAEGVAAGNAALPRRGAAGAPPAPRTVSSLGPGALNWPATAHDAVAASVLRQAGGRHRRRPAAGRQAGRQPRQQARRRQS